jgi:molecular chaperone DnaJ
MGAGVGDPFVLLGVSRVASTEEIERAYRRKVSSIHPDKFHGDPVGRQHAHEKLKQLNAAIKVLRDRRDRTSYDGGQGGN